MKKQMKKGFTLTELVIVIVIIAILAAVLIPTYTGLVQKARNNNDTSLVKMLNDALIIEEAENGQCANLTEVIAVEKEAGFLVTNLVANAKGNTLVWNQFTDRFYIYTEADGNIDVRDAAPDPTKFELNNDTVDLTGSTYLYSFWVLDTTINDTFSTYLTGTPTGSHVTGTGSYTINTTKGIDVGEQTSITEINYTNSANAQEVVIRSNSADTTLNVYAPNDDVAHYDACGTVNVLSAKTSSYHEYGKVAFMEVNAGHVEVENGASIELIYANPAEATITADGTIKKEAVTATTNAVSVTNNGDIDHAHAITPAVATDQNGTTTVEGKSIGVTFDYDGNTEQNTNTDVYHHVGTSTDGIAAGDIKITEVDYNVETGAQEAISNLHDEEVADTVVRAVSSSATNYYSFTDFAKGVNDGTITTKGVTFTLLANVDLKGIEWSAIGTSEHPFAGVFDGAGYTVKSFTISSANAKGEDGLFGFVVGDEYKINVNNLWNSTTYTLNTTNVYSGYTAVIKNLTVSGATVSSPHAGSTTDSSTYGQYGVSSNRKSCAAVVGLARYAYVENITVTKSTINGYKTVGGVVGSLDGGSVNNCKTTSSVTVNGYSNVGGIIGGLLTANTGSSMTDANSVIANCENNATINKTTTDKAYGYIGGIIGTTQNTKVAILDCTVNGIINSTNTGTATTLGSSGAVGGIAGQIGSGAYMVNCTNNATMNITGSHGFVGGITEYAGSFYGSNCINNSNISANAVQIAGILAGANGTTQFVSCVNNGTLENTKENNTTAVYDISSVASMAMLSDQTYATVADLQAALDAQLLSNCSNVKLTNIKVTDNSGSLTLPKSVQSIVADTPVCSTLSLESGRTHPLNVKIPNLAYTFESATNIFFSGEDNAITINDGVTLSYLYTYGKGTTITNNGVITGILAASNASTITNNGSVGYISVSGTNKVTINNNGTVTGVEGCHSIITQSNLEIVINNKGTINAKKGGYALLFYGNSTVTFNAYATSKLTFESGAYKFVNDNGANCHGKICTFNVATGADGAGTNNYYGIYSYSRSTYDCKRVVNLDVTLAD